MKLIVSRSRCVCVGSVLILLVCFLKNATAERECDYGLKVLWSAKLRDSPLTATPLLFDVDGDGYNDIVVPSFSGEVWSVHGENGHIVDNWPFYLDDRAFHASPLVYDLNGDGVLEFILTTTDGELVFVQSDNTLLHGETLKIPPLKIQRNWHQEDREVIQQLADQMSQQITNKDIFSFNSKTNKQTSRKERPRNFSSTYSDFDSKFGRYADPLYSTHQPEKQLSGLDAKDNTFVYVDPHVLATPTLADVNGDGEANELVIPVSYYFDPFLYGDKKIVEKQLGGLEQNELANYIAGGIVVLDLKERRILSHKMIGITRSNDDQPGYLLATPTVVNLFGASRDRVVIVGSATGELHVLQAKDLSSLEGFPMRLDSISSQVAVADLFGSGTLSLVVGDNSGNVYCIDETGKRVWEQETNVPIVSSVRFADVENDGKLEVVLTTQMGDLWILNGQDGTPYPPNYPIHLNVATQSSVLLMHLNSTSKSGGTRRTNGLAVVMSTSESIYIIDALTGCTDTFQSQHMFMEILADDIDPYSPGLELLAISLDGYMVCFSTLSSHASDFQRSIESWPGDAIGQNGFTHKSNSFAVILPHANDTNRDISGKTFSLEFQLSQYRSQSHEYSVQVTIGRKHTLYKGVHSVNQRVNDISLTVPTPPTPLRCFLTIKVCNAHAQCDIQTNSVSFNLNFEENLKWFLAVPFLFLCVFILWGYREVAIDSLPTVASSTTTRKNL